MNTSPLASIAVIDGQLGADAECIAACDKVLAREANANLTRLRAICLQRLGKASQNVGAPQRSADGSITSTASAPTANVLSESSYSAATASIAAESLAQRERVSDLAQREEAATAQKRRASQERYLWRVGPRGSC